MVHVPPLMPSMLLFRARRLLVHGRASALATGRECRAHATASTPPAPPPLQPPSSTVDPSEVRKFAALAGQWWRDDIGPFVGLHRLNEVRVPLIRRALADPARRSSGSGGSVDGEPPQPARGPLAGQQILDIGCGGGILSVALARLGAGVTGIDASSENIRAAEHHAAIDPFLDGRLRYEAITAEALVARGGSFDCVVASEVLEHVREPAAFLDACVALLRPGGKLVVTTINRTPAAFGLAILGAEYVARLVPAGTHEWAKFVTPDELRGELQGRGLRILAEPGLHYDPLGGRWSVVKSQLVNYAMVAEKAGGPGSSSWDKR